MTIHIKPLNQCPHHIDALARALYTEWHDFAPWSDIRKILNRYRHALTADTLPKVKNTICGITPKSTTGWTTCS